MIRVKAYVCCRSTCVSGHCPHPGKEDEGSIEYLVPDPNEVCFEK